MSIVLIDKFSDLPAKLMHIVISCFLARAKNLGKTLTKGL